MKKPKPLKFSYQQWLDIDKQQRLMNKEIENRLTYIGQFYLENAYDFLRSDESFQDFYDNKEEFWNNQQKSMLVVPDQLQIHFCGYSRYKKINIQNIYLFVSLKSTCDVLAVPVEWINNDFEEEFLDKVKMIKTFQ